MSRLTAKGWKAWHLPIRATAGAFILGSGLQKRGADAETAQGLQGFASHAVPQVQQLPPEQFGKALSSGEIALGTALLVPKLPSWLAGAGLTAFALGLNRLYLKAPGLRQDGSLAPTDDGLGIAKDVWLTGMGLALLADAWRDRRR